LFYLENNATTTTTAPTTTTDKVAAAADVGTTCKHQDLQSHVLQGKRIVDDHFCWFILCCGPLEDQPKQLTVK